MPIYEYRCTHCHERVEKLQKLSDPPLTECPYCHHQTLVKQVTAAGFQLKGSGWYVTDFRNGSQSGAARAGASEASSASASPGAAPSADAKRPEAPAQP